MKKDHFHVIFFESGCDLLYMTKDEEPRIWLFSPSLARTQEDNAVPTNDEDYVRKLMAPKGQLHHMEPISVAFDCTKTKLVHAEPLYVMTFARMIYNGCYPMNIDAATARTRICWELRQGIIGNGE